MALTLVIGLWLVLIVMVAILALVVVLVRRRKGPPRGFDVIDPAATPRRK